MNRYFELSLLWAIWLLALIVFSLASDFIREKKHSTQKKYLEQFIDIYLRESDFLSTLEEMAFLSKARSATGRRLRRALKSIKTRPLENPVSNRHLKKIHGKNNWAAAMIYKIAILNEGKTLPGETEKILIKLVNLWDKEINSQRIISRRQKRYELFAQISLFLLNTAIYIHWQSKISLQLALLSSFLGLFAYLLLILASFKNPKSIFAGKLAFLDWLLGVYILSTENSVIEAIKQSIAGAMKEIKPEIKKFIEQLNKDSKSLAPYNNFAGALGGEGYYQKLIDIFEIRNFSGKEAEHQMAKIIEDTFLELEGDIDKNSSKKAPATMTKIRQIYQFTGSLGLMCNIIIVVYQMSSLAA